LGNPPESGPSITPVIMRLAEDGAVGAFVGGAYDWFNSMKDERKVSKIAV